MTLFIKTEGVTDFYAVCSMVELPSDVAVWTNMFGACEDPMGMWSELAAKIHPGDELWVISDRDKAGFEGVMGVPQNDGTTRAGWATALANLPGVLVRHIVLPFELVEKGGKDFSDWALSLGGVVPGVWSELQKLAKNSPPIEPLEILLKTPLEHVDDPMRLSRMNLEQYGGTLGCHKEGWLKWKEANRRWIAIDTDELKAKIHSTVYEIFETQQENDMFDYLEAKKSPDYDCDQDEGPPTIRKVSSHLMTDVMANTKSLCIISGTTEERSWIGKRKGLHGEFLAFENGILDVEAAVTGDPDDDPVLIPPTSDWFSQVVIPYSFDCKAKCPKWEEFLAHNLEMDPERIKLLQEWCGYLLIPDTTRHKFLVLKGEGSNGKSVFVAGVIAMIGADNCSHVQLEQFGDQFGLDATFGCLVNVMSEADAAGPSNEALFKAFISGDPISFQRKYKQAITATPTARVMMSCNQWPKIKDKSDGIWRRMIYVPWNVVIEKSRVVYGMDKSTWWEAQGEAPGILRWALNGLRRLREQNSFSPSRYSDDGIESYRQDMSPTRNFLVNELQEAPGDVWIVEQALFTAYQRWCLENGHRHPCSKRKFTTELAVVYKDSQHKRLGSGNRKWAYTAVAFADGTTENTSFSTIF